MTSLEEVFEQGFQYEIDTTPIEQGAEGRVFACVYLGKPAILKERFEKKYRHPLLDQKLNKLRTRNELKGIVKAQQLGVETPSVYFVENEASHSSRIIMERIDGQTAKDWCEEQRETLKEKPGDFQELLKQFGVVLGTQIAKMHSGNLIHGDLTTSNVILREKEYTRPVFIDFGLSLQGKLNAEDKGVDLYVLERAIESTHMDSSSMFEGVLAGYEGHNKKQANVVIAKLNEIRLRGRKRDMLG